VPGVDQPDPLDASPLEQGEVVSAGEREYGPHAELPQGARREDAAVIRFGHRGAA